MTTRVKLGLVCAAGAVLAFAVAGSFCGCAAALDPATESMVAAYGADQLECVETASTRAAADDCRATVRAYWCGQGAPLEEAGACSQAAAPLERGAPESEPPSGIEDGGRDGIR